MPSHVDHKLLIEAINSIAGIVQEIRSVETAISLQSVSSGPVGKRFRRTRMQPAVQETMVRLSQRGEADKVMKCLDVHREVRYRWLADSETVWRCGCLTELRLTQLIVGEALIVILGFQKLLSGRSLCKDRLRCEELSDR
jgi:hypothetical protein